jgi:hypothetical protein
MTSNAHHSSMMHAMANILILNSKVLAGMSYTNGPMLITDEKTAVDDGDVVYHTDVETLKLVATPNPDLDRDKRLGVDYKGGGCIRGPSGKSLWDQVKASDNGFFLIDAGIW